MGRLTAAPPPGAVFNNPIGQSAFKPDIVAGLLGLDPLMLQNLFALSLKFPVERRVFEQFTRGRWLFNIVRHNREL
jgi:hypothetical protein